MFYFCFQFFIFILFWSLNFYCSRRKMTEKEGGGRRKDWRTKLRRSYPVEEIVIIVITHRHSMRRFIIIITRPPLVLITPQPPHTVTVKSLPPHSVTIKFLPRRRVHTTRLLLLLQRITATTRRRGSSRGSKRSCLATTRPSFIYTPINTLLYL